LRTAQHLHLVNVEEVECRSGTARVVDLIDVNADALFDAVVREAERRAETTDRGRRVAGIAGIELDRGLQLGQLADVEGACRLDGCGVQHRDGKRHVLGLLFTAARSDEDVVEIVRLRSFGRVNRGRNRPHKRRGNRRRETQRVTGVLREGRSCAHW
jgi:hypothetical protein